MLIRLEIRFWDELYPHGFIEGSEMDSNILIKTCEKCELIDVNMHKTHMRPLYRTNVEWANWLI